MRNNFMRIRGTRIGCALTYHKNAEWCCWLYRLPLATNVLLLFEGHSHCSCRRSMQPFCLSQKIAQKYVRKRRKAQRQSGREWRHTETQDVDLPDHLSAFSECTLVAIAEATDGKERKEKERCLSCSVTHIFEGKGQSRKRAGDWEGRRQRTQVNLQLVNATTATTQVHVFIEAEHNHFIWCFSNRDYSLENKKALSEFHWHQSLVDQYWALFR